MELFSEIYNCYYQVVARILEEAANTPVSTAEMTRIAEKYGYDESVLAIVPHLIEDDWSLLVPGKDNKTFSSRLSGPVRAPLTSLQTAWLKTLLDDERIGLFFTDEQLKLLRQLLSDTAPLYDMNAFQYFDQYRDKDIITATYRRHFHQVMNAIRTKQMLKISYYAVKGRLFELTCLPCRIEYSAKDGKFRLYALQPHKGNWRLTMLHIGRIMKIKVTGYAPAEPVDIDHYIDESVCPEPVVLEISNERNALERTMLHFSCHQKKVEKIDETGKYRCSIYYDKTRETELLIQVLAFGPVVRVLGPERFLMQVRERVARQVQVVLE